MIDENAADARYHSWFTHQYKKWKRAHQHMLDLHHGTYESNRRQLRHVLETLKNTELGQKHRIHELLLESQGDDTGLVRLFMERVPVSTYETIATDIRRMIVDGQSNLLVPPGTVALYSETTGTTSLSKQFPVHKASLEAFHLQMEDQNYVLYQQYPRLFDYDSKELFLYAQEPMKVAVDGKAIGSISMYAYQMIQQHCNYLDRLKDSNGDEFDPDFDYPPVWRYSSPPEVYEVLDHGHLEPYYLHALFSLKMRQHIRSMTSVFITNILLFFDIIRKRWTELVHDIRTARPDLNHSSIWRTIPNPLREQVITLLQPADEPLAHQIETIMNVSELPFGWGKLLFAELLITQSCCGGTMEHYCHQLQYILGDQVQCLGENYSASEGFLGVHKGYTATNKFYHAVRYCYSELLPVDQWFVDQPQCIPIETAQIGEAYELVITNLNGLYRYRMGDIIEYVQQRESEGDAPVFRLCYRRGTLLNHFAEKVTEQQILQAIADASKAQAWTLIDFCAMSSKQNDTFNHTLFIELAPEMDPRTLEHFAEDIDRHLCAANKFYGEFRLAGILQAVEIRLCKPGTFLKMKQTQVERHGRAEQFKVPRVIPAHADHLITLLLNQSTVLPARSIKLN